MTDKDNKFITVLSQFHKLKPQNKFQSIIQNKY